MKKRTAAGLLCSLFFIGIISIGESNGEDLNEPLKITVSGTSQVHGLRPVTGGVPLPKGAAPAGMRFVLLDADNKRIPCQTSVLGRWKDGSARWVLLDFQSDPPPDGKREYTLTWKKSAERLMPEVPVRVNRGRHPFIESGDVSLSPSENALLRISGRVDIQLVLVNSRGETCEAVLLSTAVETDGPLRSTLALSGEFLTPAGEREFSFMLRAAVFAGLRKIYLEPLILVDSEQGILRHAEELKLKIVPVNTMSHAEIGGLPGWSGAPENPVRLFQVDDESYIFEGAEGRGGRAPGWAEIGDESGRAAVVLRDFREQWPKSMEIDSEGLSIGLLPKFEEGTFEHMQPWYKYQYLFDGNTYRLRTGQARRWQVWLDFTEGGPGLARFANAPPMPVADPEQAVAAGVWGYVAPAGSPGMEHYDRWAENLFDNGYVKSIEKQRDYGAMNWGDWWGERGCNWGNHEYDTPKHILTQFARTGDLKYFYTGEAAARHTSEVDVIHYVNEDLRRYFETELGGNSDYPSRPGMVHEHCVGHVSGFYSVDTIRELYVSLDIGKTKNPYLCLDPYNLGHIWTRGMVLYYFLTGDPWVRKTVETIGENLARLAEDRKFPFKGWDHVGRVNGWTMLALSGAYELDFDERYLGAMRLLADDALLEQDPNCGGWLYELPWGHCYCTTRKHVGEAGFITSVRLNGLARYYELTADERIPDALRRGITHLNNDTWQEQHSDWRYTSCPATTLINQTGVTIMALVNSVKITGDQGHLRVLRKAWDAKFKRLLNVPEPGPGFGKSYSTTMYGCPEAMNLFVNGIE